MKKNIVIRSKKKEYSVDFVKFSKSLLSKHANIEDVYIVDKNVYEKHNIIKYLTHKKLIILTASEKAKDFSQISNVIKKLLKLNFRKKGKLIVIGGGIAQDVSSFISSIIFRGVDWIFFPTSLLAQCDSCIGGKTSINFYGKKNQLGNFNPPSKIFIDENFLKTQKIKEIYSGMGEMSHYFFLSNRNDYLFFKNNYKKALNKNYKIIKDLIFKTLIIKKRFVEKDEFDTNERLLLNYGHTFGHAIESITNYKIPHGIAVTHGINLSNFISLSYGILSHKEFINMNSIVKDIYQKMIPKNINLAKFIEALKKDKKNINNNLRAVFSKGVGKMFLKEIKFDKKFKEVLIEYKDTYLK